MTPPGKNTHLAIPGGDSIMNHTGHYTVSGRFFTPEEMAAINNGDYAKGILPFPKDAEAVFYE